MDWNGDGKHDWHDDAHYHALFHSDDEQSESDSSSHWSPSSEMNSGCAIAFIILLIISFFI